MPMAEILETKKGYAEPVELIALHAEQEYVNFLQWSVPNLLDCVLIERKARSGCGCTETMTAR